jgi:ribosomal protein S1
MSKPLFKSLIAFAAVLACGVALADKTHVVKGTVVAVDTAGHTLTLKGADGKTSTAPVEGDALKALASLKAGEEVSATCRDNDKGEHQAVNAVKVIKKSGY